MLGSSQLSHSCSLSRRAHHCQDTVVLAGRCCSCRCCSLSAVRSPPWAHSSLPALLLERSIKIFNRLAARVRILRRTSGPDPLMDPCEAADCEVAICLEAFRPALKAQVRAQLEGRPQHPSLCLVDPATHIQANATRHIFILDRSFDKASPSSSGISTTRVWRLWTLSITFSSGRCIACLAQLLNRCRSSLT